jgi:hypothetical protein
VTGRQYARSGLPAALHAATCDARNGYPVAGYQYDPGGQAAARTADQLLDDLRQVIAARMWAGAPLTPLPGTP